FPAFTQVGSVDVDAGCIWVGDPCYVLKDADEARPKDLGDNWHDICKRFFTRSGYDARSSDFQVYARRRDQALFQTPEFEALMAEKPRGEDFDARSWEVKKAFYEKYDAENPFKSDKIDTGVANFTHDGGHGGMGLMLSTYMGDGTYPVYVEYGEDNRPRRVLIDFD